MKSTRMQYCIKSVPSDDTYKMESLLNEMSSEGWELYTMHEVEGDEGFNYNCIFVKEAEITQDAEEDEEIEFGYKSQMQKIISAQNEPFEKCLDIQFEISSDSLKNTVEGSDFLNSLHINIDLRKSFAWPVNLRIV